jgi:Tfp pilus assembly protein PilX
MTSSTLQNNMRQQGTVLVITLLILIVITLIVLSGSRNTTLQLRMASNLQTHLEAVQKAQSAVDAVIANYNATDFRDDDLCICTENLSGDTCDSGQSCSQFKATGTWLDIQSNYLDSTTMTNGNWVKVERLQKPVDLPGFTIKKGFQGAGGGNWFATAFKVESGYNGTASGQGKAVLKIGAVKLSR